MCTYKLSQNCIISGVRVKFNEHAVSGQLSFHTLEMRVRISCRLLSVALLTLFFLTTESDGNCAPQENDVSFVSCDKRVCFTRDSIVARHGSHRRDRWIHSIYGVSGTLRTEREGQKTDLRAELLQLQQLSSATV